jgi:hypothetical protein
MRHTTQNLWRCVQRQPRTDSRNDWFLSFKWVAESALTVAAGVLSTQLSGGRGCLAVVVLLPRAQTASDSER